MNRNFTISTSTNPFSIDFDNVGLQLLDQGMDTERYTFQTTVQKVVFPGRSFSVKCYYNSTLLTANLYTKKPKDNVPASASRLLRPRSRNELLGEAEEEEEAAALEKRQQSVNWSEWPYAADISQSIGGGQGVPDCYQYDPAKPDSVGDRVTAGYQTQGPGEFCSCVWENWDL